MIVSDCSTYSQVSRCAVLRNNTASACILDLVVSCLSYTPAATKRNSSQDCQLGLTFVTSLHVGHGNGFALPATIIRVSIDATHPWQKVCPHRVTILGTSPPSAPSWYCPKHSGHPRPRCFALCAPRCPHHHCSGSRPNQRLY